MSEKDRMQFVDELVGKLTEHFKRNGFNLARYDSAARFDGWVQGFDWVQTEVVDVLTADWSVDKEMLDLDVDGILRDPSAPLRHAGDDYDTSKARKVIRYEIVTAPRDLTDAEQAALDEREARWQAKRDRDRAVWQWQENGGADVPPPDGIRIDELLQQIHWWVTRDGRKVRIADIEPSHRLNLFKLMHRNAESWRNAELNRFLMQGAPDDVTSSAEHLGGPDWLAEQRLYQELRNLVLVDQVGADTCRIEWADDKPTGCLAAATGHVCVREPGHKKRCACQCGARPAKQSSADKEARRTRDELKDLRPTAEQEAMVDMLFGRPAPSTGKTVNEEVAARFMNLGAAERMGLKGKKTLDRFAETFGPLGPEDIH